MSKNVFSFVEFVPEAIEIVTGPQSIRVRTRVWPIPMLMIRSHDLPGGPRIGLYWL